jgi:hypothetical protein
VYDYKEVVLTADFMQGLMLGLGLATLIKPLAFHGRPDMERRVALILGLVFLGVFAVLRWK